MKKELGCIIFLLKKNFRYSYKNKFYQFFLLDINIYRQNKYINELINNALNFIKFKNACCK